MNPHQRKHRLYEIVHNNDRDGIVWTVDLDDSDARDLPDES